jgi:RNA polymerase sigma-70 factor (ECF subfamily)
MRPPVASPESDLRLALAARDGDRAAFEQLVLRHDHRLRRLCTRVAGNPADGDDAVQEAWLRAMAAIGSFTPGDVAAWLSVIARNEAHRVASSRRPTEGIALRVELPAAAADPFERSSGGEVVATITKALRRLPAGQREVVIRDAVGQSPEESAAALGLTRPALRLQRHRARKALRAALDGPSDPPALRAA